MAFDVGVRDYLQGKGVSSGDIGYDQNSGNVTVKGQNFLKPDLNMAGTTYSNQQNLDNAYNHYAKQQTTPDTGMMYAAGSAAGVDPGAGQGGSSASSSTGSTTGGNGQTSQYTNPYTQQIADLMKHLSDSSNGAQPDVYNSPQYAAAQAAQARQSQLAVRQANESAAGAGLGHSTIMTDRSQRIQDDSNNYLQTQLVPQIMNQLRAQRQQELANQQNQLHDYMQLGQQADLQHNADRTYNAGRQDAATTATGYYNPSGMTADQINQEIAKNSADYANATPQQQHDLHLRNLELNSLLGKTDTTGNGDYAGGNPNGQIGYKTLATKTLEQNIMKDTATLSGMMPDGKGGMMKTSAQQQQDLTNEWNAADRLGKITPALAQMYNLPEGTPTEKAKEFAATLAVQNRQADASMVSANASASNAATNAKNAETNAAHLTKADDVQSMNQKFEEWKLSGKAPAGIPNVTEGTSLYDRTAAQKAVADAYKTWNETGVAPEGIPGVTPGTPKYNATANNRASFNKNESDIAAQIDAIPKANQKKALQGEKSAIIAKVGDSGYNRIYGLYFDQFGNPK